MKTDVLACCTPVRADLLGDSEAVAVAQAFAALADPVRLRLLNCIAAAEAGEVCACDLGAVVDRSQPTISHHMKVLVEAGLVARDKRGLWVWYRVVPERLDALRAVLG
jgi:ArsR family transcriptional regulator